MHPQQRTPMSNPEIYFSDLSITSYNPHLHKDVHYDRGVVRHMSAETLLAPALSG
jgi:hypothetical protein